MLMFFLTASFACRYIFGHVGQRTDVVIVTHNALMYAQKGLLSVKTNTDWRTSRLYIVDSGSDVETISWLEQFCEPSFCTFSSLGNVGYTKAANFGVRQAHSSAVVLMNPDVLVCRTWIDKLLEALSACKSHALVGPLSNAASFQSFPDVFAGDGALKINHLPEGVSHQDMCDLLDTHSLNDFPDATFINGFLMLFKRKAFEEVGGLDEVSFPVGYGEENDFAIRLQNAGYTIAIADNTYAFHFKTTGFSPEERRTLSQAGSRQNHEKHGAAFFDTHVDFMKSQVDFMRSKHALTDALQALGHVSQPLVHHLGLTIYFHLPVRGAGGGVISIVQVVKEMQLIGIKASITIQRSHEEFYVSHPSFENENHDAPIFIAYDNDEDLRGHFKRADAVVATIFTSLPTVLSLMEEENANYIPAYFIQDYEAYFGIEGSTVQHEAIQSYTSAKEYDVLCFAKTRWLTDVLREKHDLHVHLVTPSLDHDIYAGGHCSHSKPLHIVAMVRTSTPRRSPLMTMKILSALKQEFGKSVFVTIFGSTKQDVKQLQKVRALSKIKAYDVNREILATHDVSHLLRGADIFLDLSTYQAFGRTAVECMASNCIPVVPSIGGAADIVADGSGVAVDTSDFEAIMKALRNLFNESARNIRIMKLRGRIRAATMTSRKAAREIAELVLNKIFT